MTKVNAAVQSPLEKTSIASIEQKLALARRCSHEGAIAGAKAAIVATIATAIPTVSCCMYLPVRHIYDLLILLISSSFIHPSDAFSVGKCKNAAMGKSQPQSHRSSSHNLYRYTYLIVSPSSIPTVFHEFIN